MCVVPLAKNSTTTPLTTYHNTSSLPYHTQLKARHWEEIINITGLEFEVSPATNLEQMLAINLQHHVPAIEDTCTAASKENGLDKNMDKMEVSW